MTIDCHTSRDWMTAYMAHGLSEKDTYAMERHLRGCTECAQEIRELKPMFHYLNMSMEAPQEPAVLSPERMQALLHVANTQEEVKATILFPRALKKAVVWGSMAASIFLGSYLGMQSGQEKIQPEEIIIELNAPNLNIASNTEPAPINPAIFANFKTAMQKNFLPEYGLGILPPKTTADNAQLVQPYYGLPGPRPQHIYSPGYAMDLHQ